MKDITETLKGFESLAAFRDFLQEKINDGQEISRGKDPNDKSKEQKSEEPPADDKEEEEAEGPVIDPTAAPGSQVTIGNKELEGEEEIESSKIEISGKQEKINMKPQAKLDPSNGINSQ